MAKVNVVFIDWRDRQYPPEIVGVYADPVEAEEVVKAITRSLEEEGYGPDKVNVVYEEKSLQ